MLSVTATEEWKSAHPGASIGLLEVSGVDNTLASTELEARKREVEALLREKYQGYTRQDFLSIPVMLAYVQYYKRFSKTYHVLQQVESIVLKNRNLPAISPLVDSNFIAEVDTLALTAGHDVSKLKGSILIDIARNGDQMVQMNNVNKEIYAGDMIMKDDGGICCCIIYGQDNFSPISPETSHALYVVYAPAGVPIETVEAQLQAIEANIRLFAPSVTVKQSRVITS
ncbi:MAG TPA: phenylalanine--tRNA ligase beta subunit-related protein [Anaerolineales bacterium]|nr:phenylalanine--tRNA ligase beta subunit-related protein [Anaerolineales bacterium]